MSAPEIVRIAGNGAAPGIGADLLAALVSLHSECFTPMPETPWSETAFRTLLAMPTTHAWIAGRMDEPAGGVLQGLLVARELAGDWEVLTVCVAPGARRRGVARALFARFLECVGEEAHVVLEVAVNNDPAIALYMESGFQPVGRRPGYYAGAAKPVDALILARTPQKQGV